MAPTVQEKIHVNLQKVYTEKLLPHPWEVVAPPVELPWECLILCLGNRKDSVREEQYDNYCGALLS